jgi:hypothetical protein
MYTGIECTLETGADTLYIGVHSPESIFGSPATGHRPLATKKRRNNGA